MKKNSKTILCFGFLLLASLSIYAGDHLKNVLAIEDKAFNFIVANDLGRNGYYEQKKIAALMGETAEEYGIEFIAAAGDVHHYLGVQSVNDPLWMTNFELIYSHPELMVDWNAICGNHEYHGNTQAIVDYTQVSRRWNAPAKYYTQAMKTDDGESVRFVYIDTTPLIDKYRKDTVGYPDACKESLSAQLQWVDSTLRHSSERWKIVVGHHPVYADTGKDEDERLDMQRRLAPILERNQVDVYFCGHIHNFQHIQPKSSKVQYVVNSSASLSRKVNPTPDTKFCSPAAGFTFCSLTKDAFTFFFIHPSGEVLYRYRLTK